AVACDNGEEVFATTAEGRGGFAAVNQLVWELLAERGKLTRRLANPRALVIKSDEVHRRGHGLGGAGQVHGRRGAARGVFLVHDVAELLCPRRTGFAGGLFTDLIADAPNDDGGMVSIASKMRAQVLLMPVGKNEMKIQRRFLAHPDIE